MVVIRIFVSMKRTSGILIYGDLVASSGISSESDLPERLSFLEVHFGNEKGRVNFAIWKGLDEIMFIAEHWNCAMNSILLIQEMLHPFKYRYEVMPIHDIEKGKAIHELTNPEFAIISDRMARLKETDLLIHMEDENSSKLIESSSVVLNLLLLRKGEFTTNQMQQYRLHKKGLNQKLIARELNVSQQSISKTLNQIQFNSITTIEERLLNLFTDGTN